MISLKYSEIPSYLHDSGFYRSLDAEDGQGAIEIPSQALKQDCTVTSVSDLHQLVRTMHFWMLEQIPESGLLYCFNNSTESWGVDIEVGSTVLSDLKKVFISQEKDVDEDIMCRAIETGRLEIVSFLVKIAEREHQATAATCAAKHGNLHILTFLHTQSLPWDSTTTDAAARHGHLDCLQYAHTHGCPLDTSALTAAATGGHLSCLQYIISTGIAWHRDVCSAAAEQGHLHILTYAYNNDCPWDDFVTENAAKHGHLQCLQFALERGCAMSEVAAFKACVHGHLDCLALLYDCEAPIDDITAALAAEHGHLHCVMFLIERGIGLTARTTCTAASCGQLHVLRYLLDTGVPYISTLLPFAVNALQNRLECTKYLIEEQGLHMHENGSLFGNAFMRADYECVQYLISIGCPYMMFKFRDFCAGDIVNVSQFDGTMVQCIEHALMHGWKCDKALYKAVCKYKLFLCKEYLEREGHGVVEEVPEEEDYYDFSLFD